LGFELAYGNQSVAQLRPTSCRLGGIKRGVYCFVGLSDHVFAAEISRIHDEAEVETVRARHPHQDDGPSHAAAARPVLSGAAQTEG